MEEQKKKSLKKYAQNITRKRKKQKSEIAYQNKDIAAKILGDGLIGKSFAVYGRPDIKIVEAMPTNLPAIEANELRLDHLFRLVDGSIAIIDYESTFQYRNLQTEHRTCIVN